jgi:hypothetical protein
MTDNPKRKPIRLSYLLLRPFQSFVNKISTVCAVLPLILSFSITRAESRPQLLAMACSSSLQLRLFSSFTGERFISSTNPLRSRLPFSPGSRLFHLDIRKTLTLYIFSLSIYLSNFMFLKKNLGLRSNLNFHSQL